MIFTLFIFIIYGVIRLQFIRFPPPLTPASSVLICACVISSVSICMSFVPSYTHHFASLTKFSVSSLQILSAMHVNSNAVLSTIDPRTPYLRVSFIYDKHVKFKRMTLYIMYANNDGHMSSLPLFVRILIFL